MNKRKKPINGLLILTIMAAALWYSGYINENQYINKQIEVFSHIGQKASEKDYQEVSRSDGFGYIQPQVVDGFSQEPIEGATVVIPEMNQTYITDEKGYTPNIRIRVSPDPHFQSIHPKTWGETTLIVYKDGYVEYVLLHLNVWEEQSRQGPKILLFPQKNKQLDQPMSIVEGPSQLWINSLVEKYRP
ncbi:MAG: carboxypeptidase-like regulatory domain-containing protein [Clostridiales bacterium]|nr:carboxypeptidase-like regulatory domain-containing protein [Clostridiales bacterium]